MKLVAEHLGEIILAIAAVAILVGLVIAFEPVIGSFFQNIVDQLNGVAMNSDMWAVESVADFEPETMAPIGG